MKYNYAYDYYKNEIYEIKSIPKNSHDFMKFNIDNDENNYQFSSSIFNPKIFLKIKKIFEKNIDDSILYHPYALIDDMPNPVYIVVFNRQNVINPKLLIELDFLICSQNCNITK